MTVAYCVVYLLVGPALILTNKQIMRDVGFHFPMMVSGIGQASSAICSLVAIRVLGIQPLANAHLVSWHFYLRNMMVVGAAPRRRSASATPATSSSPSRSSRS